ncbi:MAG: glycosyltransferase family 1 protein [Planctomycetota bacterium]|nr:glycosyltransferase family 1 protein [Planctomycetota bacterium]
MRIALDISSAARPDATGVAMYIRRLVAAFARVGKEHSFTLVTRASRLKNLFHMPPPPARNFSSKILIEGLHPFFSRSTHVFHGLDARLPGRWLKAKTVVTVHDVFSVLQSQEFATPEFREMKARRYRELVGRADRIICVSDCVRRDVQEALQADPAKLRVVHEGGGEGFSPRPAEEVQAVRARYGLDRPYLLFVGSINKRKNVPALVQAFAAARARTRSDMLFAIAGRVGYGGEEIRAAIGKSACADAVKLLGYVADGDIAPLYTGAHALLFATLYEGFGIPVIEAFACGCPVIGATTGSLPEVIGDAGLLADPHSVDSIAAQIEKLATDDALRRACIEKGLLRAKEFTWDKAAAKCLTVYQELA